MQNIFELLIVPVGIEIGEIDLVNFPTIELLIVPVGIEIYLKHRLLNNQLPFNRTSWN